ncbi:MspA family porin [Nocardia inohanensis]|uniref:MspA family porin n=1 Tax=Nocardia inohanensis TaxID=209246 RepID=UPI000837345E|nr:MspA family porin [Nocardia inohanensis]
MIIKTATAAVLAATGLVFGATAGIAPASAADLAPHEKTTTAPNGMAATVGHLDNAAWAITGMNGMPTSREVYLNNTAYGRVAAGTGKIKTGFFVGCAIDLDVKFTMSAAIGGSASATLGAGLGSSGLMPSATFSIGPTVTGSMGVALTLDEGKYIEVKGGEKTIPAGGTAYLVNRDIRATVENCAGPVTVKAYTIIEATSPEADVTDWVMGDPAIL